jgi:trehalose 6-phosphate phosphatase
MQARRLKRAQTLRPSSNWALFLDVDGTILGFADTPNGVAPSDRVTEVLREIDLCLEGAVALISGRTIGNLDHLFAQQKLPAAGLHGLERRDAGGCLHVLGEAETLEHLRAPLKNLASSHAGAILEDKGRALAIHYRRAPDAAEEIRRRVEALVRPSSDELRIIHGKMVSEVKPRHADKGSAIRAFMEEVPFTGRLPVFIGDDVTDEDGFAVVNALKGYAILVGDGPSKNAHYGLPGVNEVIEWLETWPSIIPRLAG